MATDGWIASFQSKIRENADRTLEGIDSPFSRKSFDTLNALAEHVSTLGIDDPYLDALALIGGALGHGTDTWTAGPEQSSALAGAGFGSEGIAPNIVLGQLIAKGIEDVSAHQSRDRDRVTGEAARARAEALEAVAEEKRGLEQERDRARGDLDAERARSEGLERDLDYLKLLLNAAPGGGPRKVRRSAGDKKTAKRPRAAAVATSGGES